MQTIVIPRYFYLGTAEDIMRDRRSIRLWQSFKEAYLRSRLDWNPRSPVMLMWDSNYNLLAAKDVTKELTKYETWYQCEAERINNEFARPNDREQILDGTVSLARQLAYKELNERAQTYLEEIGFDCIGSQS